MESGMTIKANEHTFEASVMHSELPVLVEFHARWCAPCRRLEPVLETLAERYTEVARVARVDIDESPALSRLMGVRSVPSVALIHQGQVRDLLIGERPIEDYEKILDELLWEDAAPGRRIRNDLKNALVI
jgi:thioredoxin 1